VHSQNKNISILRRECKKTKRIIANRNHPDPTQKTTNTNLAQSNLEIMSIHQQNQYIQQKTLLSQKNTTIPSSK